MANVRALVLRAPGANCDAEAVFAKVTESAKVSDSEMKSYYEKHKKDYYDRLTYVAADRSEQMLVDACRHGIFAHHPGRYLLRVADALEPGGILLLGKVETLFGPARQRLVLEDPRERIYRRPA